jgi:hypothetical protein
VSLDELENQAARRWKLLLRELTKIIPPFSGFFRLFFRLILFAHLQAGENHYLQAPHHAIRLE